MKKMIISFRDTKYRTSNEVSIIDSNIRYSIENGFLIVIDNDGEHYCYNVKDVVSFKLLNTK